MPSEASILELIRLADRLQAFKDWVHKYLDARGVPKEFPDGVHTYEGCRVGDRLDWLVKVLGATSAEDALKAELKSAIEEIERLQGVVKSLTDRVAGQAEVLSKRAERSV